MRFASGLGVFILFLAGSPVSATIRAPMHADLSLGEKALEGMPSWFEPNRGQLSEQVRFEARSRYGRLSILSTGADFSCPHGKLELRLVGASAHARHRGEQLQTARTNYVVGNHPEHWRMGVPHFARVRWMQPYPGIDVAYYFNGARLEYDLVVAPGADPGQIRLKFNGARGMRLDERGSLHLDMGGAEVIQAPPVAYQQNGAKRTAVEARYRIRQDGEIGIALGPYNRDETLVIDPILYAGYTKGQENQLVRGVALDKDGGIWITGSAFGEVDVTELPQPYASVSKAYRDAFVARFSIGEDGSLSLLYWAYIGGSDFDAGGAIAVNADGRVYVAGETSSTDFPTAGTQMQNGAAGKADAFLLVIDPSAAGTDSLVYSSYFGGEEDEMVRGMALDQHGRAIVIGTSNSPTLPAVEYGVQGANRGGYEIFLFKVDPAPDAEMTFLYSSFFGGDSTDIAAGVAVNPEGNVVYFAGYTFSSDFPTTWDGWQTTERGYGDAFIVKLNLDLPGLDALVYATCIGGTDLDVATGIGLDSNEDVWITGYTMSVDFPVTADAAQSRFAGEVDGFVVRFTPSAGDSQPLKYATYLGGSDADVPNVLKLLGDGRVAVAGYTISNDMPARGDSPAVQMVDAFISILDPGKPGAAGLLSTTTFGGAYVDAITALALDAAGDLYAAGSTYSFDLPTTDGSGKPSEGGVASGFLLKLKP